MEIQIQCSNHTLTIYLCGELDESVAEFARNKLDDAVSQPGINCVVFDLCELSFMDSTGIGVLIGRYKRLKNRNVSIYVKNPTSTVDKILKMSGLYEIMPRVK